LIKASKVEKMTPEDRALLIAEIASAIQSSARHNLSEEELQWVRLAISAQARKIRFRDAVIEKSLAGLVWAAIVGVGYILVDFLKNHGFKVS
jgi:hypothetical protein